MKMDGFLCVSDSHFCVFLCVFKTFVIQIMALDMKSSVTRGPISDCDYLVLYKGFPNTRYKYNRSCKIWLCHLTLSSFSILSLKKGSKRRDSLFCWCTRWVLEGIDGVVDWSSFVPNNGPFKPKQQSNQLHSVKSFCIQ